jgi:hypothetical protein
VENWTLYIAATHLLRYNRGTSDLCLTFDGKDDKTLAQIYADADLGGDFSARPSIAGYFFRVWWVVACKVSIDRWLC